MALPTSGHAAILGQNDYFPTTSGSSWTYAVNGLTTNKSGNQVMLSGNETVTVTGSGVFHSEITFSNGNTTTTDNNYFLQDAAYIVSTHNVIHSSMTSPIPSTTTTTTDTTYSPSTEWFPSELFAGNVESSSSQFTTTGTSVTVIMGHAGSGTINNAGSYNVSISVAGTDSITVGAGTFSAVKLVTTIQVTESGNTSTYTTNAWYAEGIGLVKFTSPNLNRDLVSYAVNPVEPSQVEISGKAGSFSSLQGALDAATDRDTLMLRATNYAEDATLRNTVDISLKGGLSHDYTTVVGYSHLQGSLTIQEGNMAVSNLIIH